MSASYNAVAASHSRRAYSRATAPPGIVASPQVRTRKPSVAPQRSSSSQPPVEQTENTSYMFGSKGWEELAYALQENDSQEIDRCCNDIDTILTFAGLFSAAVTAFNVESYKLLQQDPADLSSNILLHISQQLQNLTMGAGGPVINLAYTVPAFQKSNSAVRLNMLWFSSLVFSLIAAALSILAKEWLREYLAGTQRNNQEFVRVRQFRRLALEKWHVFGIIALLPLLMHIALILFFVGLGEFLFSLDSTVGTLATVIFGSWIFLHAVCTASPVIFPRCPYITPLTKHTIRTTRNKIWQLRGQLRSLLRYTPRELSQFYTFPYDEMGLRRDEKMDMPALVKADDIFMDDAFMSEVIYQCLEDLDGEKIRVCVRHFLSHRLALSSYKSPLAETNFAHLGVRALVSTTDAISGGLCRQMVKSHSIATQESDDDFSKCWHAWIKDSIHYIVLALDHCEKADQNPPPSLPMNMSRILGLLLKGGEEATRELLLLLQNYPSLNRHLAQAMHAMSAEGSKLLLEVIRNVCSSARRLIPAQADSNHTTSSSLLNLCGAILSIARILVDIHDGSDSALDTPTLGLILDESPFGLVGVLLQIAQALTEQEYLAFIWGEDGRMRAGDVLQILAKISSSVKGPLCKELQDVLSRISDRRQTTRISRFMSTHPSPSYIPQQPILGSLAQALHTSPEAIIPLNPDASPDAGAATSYHYGRLSTDSRMGLTQRWTLSSRPGRLNPLLSAEESTQSMLVFDLSLPNQLSLKRISSLGRQHVRVSQLLQDNGNVHMACWPGVTRMTITCDDLNSLGFKVSIPAQGSSSKPIGVGEVLLAIYNALQRTITEREWETVSSSRRTTIARAYYRRCRIVGTSQAFDEGIKLVDLLENRFMFEGLVRLPGDERFENLKLKVRKSDPGGEHPAWESLSEFMWYKGGA